MNKSITSITDAQASSASNNGLNDGEPNSTIAKTALPILVVFNLVSDI